MKFPFRIPPFVYNKYLLATLCFIGWMLFFDKNDVFTQRQRTKELQALEQSRTYYKNEIAAERKFSDELKQDPAAIEKFAREHYKMKRRGEDLFLIERPKEPQN